MYYPSQVVFTRCMILDRIIKYDYECKNGQNNAAHHYVYESFKRILEIEI